MKKISDRIYYVGVNDDDKVLFEGYSNDDEKLFRLELERNLLVMKR